MSTIIFPSPIFGPVQSRRLGVSLGINLLPGDGKFCNFDCIYCECGFNKDFRAKEKLPTREAVKTQLEETLQKMKSGGSHLDVFTFAGNGEPTSHPHFAEIIADTLDLRDRYFPEAKVSVLSNATLIHRPAVFEALLKVDNNILKLDTIDEAYIHQVNCPTGTYNVAEIIAQMKAFRGKLIVQTMFLKGEDIHGNSVDNTTDRYVLPWLKAVKEIAPSQVMIYTIDRETPTKSLKKVAKEELDRIVELLRAEGLQASASY